MTTGPVVTSGDGSSRGSALAGEGFSESVNVSRSARRSPSQTRPARRDVAAALVLDRGQVFVEPIDAQEGATPYDASWVVLAKEVR